jgi:hypothetical protein
MWPITKMGTIGLVSGMVWWGRWESSGTRGKEERNIRLRWSNQAIRRNGFALWRISGAGDLLPKENDLSLLIFATWVFGWRGKCGCGWERESGTHHKFAPIWYLLGVNGIRGQNIRPTIFAPHVWHLRGKLGVNLPIHPIYLTIQTGPWWQPGHLVTTARHIL